MANERTPHGQYVVDLLSKEIGIYWDENNRPMRVSELAKLLRVPDSTIRSWLHRYNGPWTKVYIRMLDKYTPVPHSGTFGGEVWIYDLRSDMVAAWRPQMASDIF